MARVARLLADKVGFDDKQAETLELAASLSQIGKIYVPRYILNKKGKLTPEELQEVRKAPEYANKILHELHFELPVAETVSMISERMDGSGQPLGLKGDHIPVCGRALAVINDFIAMISPRSWRSDKGMNIRQAIDQLEADPGFDQVIVSALASLSQQELMDATKQDEADVKDIEEFRARALAEHEKEVHEKDRQNALISAFVRAIESIDPSLLGQSAKMSRVARLLAAKLKLDEKQTETLELAASLSQIGKIYVPRYILNKKGKLTPEELQEVRKAPEYANRILTELHFDLPVAETVQLIGERYDGSGQPLGLKGDQISICGRALEVINAFVAMISPRIWRSDKGMNITQAIENLKVNPGFDQTIVTALADLPYEELRNATKQSNENIKDIEELRAQALEEHSKEEQEKERQTALFGAFVRAIESVDPTLLGHSEKMANVAWLLGKAINLNEDQMKTLELAATLSQVGKIYVPRELLNKKGKLTPEELQEVRKAPEYADKILNDLHFDLPVAETMRMINERVDGSGQPRGLREHQIPVCGRALEVINAFIAMTSPRVWRSDQGMNIQEALAQLKSEAGFDQYIVDALANIPEDLLAAAIKNKS